MKALILLWTKYVASQNCGSSTLGFPGYPPTPPGRGGHSGASCLLPTAAQLIEERLDGMAKEVKKGNP